MCTMSRTSPYRDPLRGAAGITARSTAAFAAIGDHERLPSRFFPCLNASDGSLLRG